MTYQTDLLLALSLAGLAMRFGQVRRATQHEDGEAESDTTHTVMLALLVMEVAPRVGADVGLAVQFAVVHDLPETHAGDTNTARGLSPEEAASKASRELEALSILSAAFNGTRMIDMLARYEAQVELEARLVRYLDKVLPKLTHYHNRGSALAAMGLTRSDVREKHAQQGASLAAKYPELAVVGDLFAAACRLVEDEMESWPLAGGEVSGG
jgi:5'-deoxynucleotidase YfbR-like HD superfamily hydrolase